MSAILALGIAHGLSDAAAGFAVGVLLQMDNPQGGLLIFLYNGLAFGLQPIAGLLLDRLERPGPGAAFGLFLTSTGLALFWPDPRLGIILIGLGSAFFHAGGGAISILNSAGKASGPGTFAAFGVVGLVLGTRLSFGYAASVPWLFALVLLIPTALALSIRAGVPKGTESFGTLAGFEIPLILILMAFALRSLVWTGVDRAVGGSADLALFIGMAAGVGKLAGGFLADRLGWLRWVLFSLGGAGLFLFAREHAMPLLVGVFLLQSVTGPTIAWFGRLLPGSPAFAASLALGAAVALGGLPFAFSGGAWFGTTAIVLCLTASLIGYWLVLRAAGEKIELN